MRGPWRVAVAERSMLPTVAPGDWLLVDPTTDRWPRRGSLVVFREPGSDLLAIKRVAGRPGDWVPFADGWLQLADDEAWLLSDAAATDSPKVDAAAEADREPSTHGEPIDSRRYGPVPVTALVGRVWLRYWPLPRVGPLRRRSGPMTPGPRPDATPRAGLEEPSARADTATTTRDDVSAP